MELFHCHSVVWLDARKPWKLQPFGGLDQGWHAHCRLQPLLCRWFETLSVIDTLCQVLIYSHAGGTSWYIYTSICNFTQLNTGPRLVSFVLPSVPTITLTLMTCPYSPCFFLHSIRSSQICSTGCYTIWYNVQYNCKQYLQYTVQYNKTSLSQQGQFVCCIW